MARLSSRLLLRCINQATYRGKQSASVALAIAIAFFVYVVFVLSAGLLPETISPVQQPARLAVTAGLSLFIVILLAASIGTTVPLFLNRFGIDPALATGPFITTSNDIIGLIVFFVLATLLYLPYL